MRISPRNHLRNLPFFLHSCLLRTIAWTTLLGAVSHAVQHLIVSVSTRTTVLQYNTEVSPVPHGAQKKRKPLLGQSGDRKFFLFAKLLAFFSSLFFVSLIRSRSWERDSFASSRNVSERKKEKKTRKFQWSDHISFFSLSRPRSREKHLENFALGWLQRK